MEKPSFQEAVSRSKQYLLSGMQDGLAPTADGQDMMVTMKPPMAKTTIGVWLLRENPSKLISLAASSADGFDVAQRGIAYALEQKEELPEIALDWLVQVLRGEKKRPKALAGAKQREWLRMLIWNAIHMRVREGMKATRNDVSEATSACDVVAKALAELELTPTTFDGVKRIWLNMESKAKRGIATT